jgi:thymidylate synthase (FAD)
MVSACIEVETTRDIARQLLRHRSFSFQEFSQRYADPTAELDDAFVLREARLQDTKNRQNSVEFDMTEEQARAVLPEGLTVSRLYVNGTLRSWIHYIDLRDGNGTQKEHAEIARACAEVIAKVFPIIKSIREGI